MPDVVVIGAGPAGLACAAALEGLEVLLLEADKQPGGRIRTVALGGQAVDTGACFAFDAALLPAGHATGAGTLIRERDPLGFCADGVIHYAPTPLECLAQLALDPPTREQIARFAHGAVDAQALRGTRAFTLLDALLHQIHPGALADYDPQHQRDGFYTWYPDHWEAGNRSLVTALLADSRARLQCATTVSSVRAHAQRVEVCWASGATSHRVECSAAVIATTADVAAQLWPAAPAPQRELLGATRYGAYLVVALAGPASAALPSFRSLVSAEHPPVVLSQQRSVDRRHATLLCYFADSESAALAPLPDAELVRLARERIAALGIPQAALDALEATTVARWPRAATILCSEYRRCRAQATATPADGPVFLAGDYASPQPGVGYGIEDAINAGRGAAQQVRARLARQHPADGALR